MIEQKVRYLRVPSFSGPVQSRPGKNPVKLNSKSEVRLPSINAVFRVYVEILRQKGQDTFYIAYAGGFTQFFFEDGGHGSFYLEILGGIVNADVKLGAGEDDAKYSNSAGAL